MFIWFIYLISCLSISFIISTVFHKKIRIIIFFLVLVLLLTPENMGIGFQEPSPVVFSFIFDSIFEQNISIRTLRPLVFSLPLALTLGMIFLRFRKRFFQS